MQPGQAAQYTCFGAYDMSVKENLIENAKQGKILAHRCTACEHLHLSTVYFCQKCGSKGFEDALLAGTGSIVTYTIITVPPTGFEKYTPYAFVVLGLDNSNLRISGFMGGIATPADLPIRTRAKVVGYDQRGILIEKQ